MPLLSDLLGAGLALLIAAGPLPLSLILAASPEQRLNERSSEDILLATFVYWSACQVSFVFLLGSLGVSTLPNIVALELTCLLVGIVRFSRSKRLFFDVVAAAERWVSALRSDGHARWQLWGAGYLAVLMSFTVTTTLMTDYDSLLYHLPIMAQWYSYRSLDVPKDYFQSTYPLTWEAFSSLLIFPFGTDVLVGLANVAAWVMFLLAVYGIGRRLGATRPASGAIAIVGATAPVILEQVGTMHVDLAAGALFAVVLALLLPDRETGAAGDRRAAVMAGALLLGVKTSAGGYLLALAVYAAASSRLAGPARTQPSRPGRSRRRLWLEWAPWLVWAAALGGFWYARNLIEMGNPLGFVGVSFRGTPILPGIVDLATLQQTTIARVLDPGSRRDWQIVADGLIARYGLNVALLLLGAAGALADLRPGRSRAWRWRVALTLGLGLASLWLHVNTPFSGTNEQPPRRLTILFADSLRYSIPLIVAIGALASIGTRRLRVPAIAWTAVAGVFLALAARRFDPGLALGIAAGWALTVAAGTLGGKFLHPAIAARGLWIAVGLTVVAALGLVPQAQRLRSEQRPAVYGEAARFLDTLDRADLVAYTSSHRGYLFFGERLDRRLVYLPIDVDQPERWLATVCNRGARWLVIGPVPDATVPAATLARIERQTATVRRVVGADPLQETVIYRLECSGTQARERGIQ